MECIEPTLYVFEHHENKWKCKDPHLWVFLDWAFTPKQRLAYTSAVTMPGSESDDFLSSDLLFLMKKYGTTEASLTVMPFLKELWELEFWDGLSSGIFGYKCSACRSQCSSSRLSRRMLKLFAVRNPTEPFFVPRPFYVAFVAFCSCSSYLGGRVEGSSWGLFISTCPFHLFSDYCEDWSEAQRISASLLDSRSYETLVDFDNHLDDIRNDWTNPEINKAVLHLC